jgi:hypothetical protein
MCPLQRYMSEENNEKMIVIYVVPATIYKTHKKMNEFRVRCIHKNTPQGCTKYVHNRRTNNAKTEGSEIAALRSSLEQTVSRSHLRHWS